MLAFVEAIERENTITIDGYTTNKTEKGIIKDVARAIKKYSVEESEALMNVAKDYDEELNHPFVRAINSEGGYFFEYEGVPCACKTNEVTGETEYKEGFSNYFCIRIVL